MMIFMNDNNHAIIIIVIILINLQKQYVFYSIEETDKETNKQENS